MRIRTAKTYKYNKEEKTKSQMSTKKLEEKETQNQLKFNKLKKKKKKKTCLQVGNAHFIKITHSSFYFHFLATGFWEIKFWWSRR